jgi:hypothetical protein
MGRQGETGFVHRGKLPADEDICRGQNARELKIERID